MKWRKRASSSEFSMDGGIRSSSPQKQKTQSSEERLGNFYITLHSLPPKTQREAYSGRFSGLRIILILAPSRPHPSTSSGLRAVDLASFVPDYSGVAVPGSHGVPFSALGHLNTG